MKHIFLLLITFTALSCNNITAQNTIDRLVDQYCAVGNSKYTSVVQRNPETGKVIRVVKTLYLPYQSVAKFKNAFQNEANTGDNYTETNGNTVTSTLIVNKQQNTRVYTLRYNKNREPNTRAQTTIIIKYNPKQ